MTNYYGHFSGNPRTEWLQDVTKPDREMRLLEDFWYEDPDGRTWFAREGSIINGASIPRPLWTVVGSPYTDDYRIASVVHDVACNNSRISRKEADKMFYYACLAGGCSKYQARLLYAGVRVGDWADTHNLLLNRSELLYRVTGVPLPQEDTLIRKYSELSEMIVAFDEEIEFESLEELVDSALLK